jgi:hypothetical protein
MMREVKKRAADRGRGWPVVVHTAASSISAS